MQLQEAAAAAADGSEAMSPATWWWVVMVWSVPTVLPSPQRATKLAQSATEILYIEDGYPDHRTYKLEDFFWTGSGDGAPENPWDESDKTSTIYKTKTVMSTVFISISDNNQTNTETESPTECAIDCETVTIPDGTITPTPTFENHTTTSPISGVDHGNSTADKYFWLLTVIKTEGEEPVVAVLEKRLAKLYSVAFRRQQERHLGIAKGKRPKRQSPHSHTNGNGNGKFPSENKPVNVCIHTIERNDETKEVEVLYHVLVSGKPVAAITAASDMRFVTDEEVAKELGFPVRTKAEPYIKPQHPESLARLRDTWLFIGVALATIFLLLFMVTIFTFCLNKRKRTMLPVRPSGVINRQHIFERENGNGGHDNSGYVAGAGESAKTYHSGRRYHRKSPARPRANTSNDTLTSRYPEGRPLSSQSSVATSSSTSSDASPLMLPLKHRSSHSRNKKHRLPDKRPSAINKTLLLKQATVGVESDSSTDKGSDIILVKDSENRGGKISPKSYLSMPSVKAFPRSSIPETLNKVLEPVSVLHLDMADDIMPEPSPIYHRPGSGKKLIRVGSMGSEDPGVIGPVVWDLHCKRLQNTGHLDGQEDAKGENHGHRMRRRFNELLDDTFSLFGTSKESQEPAGYTTSTSSTRNAEARGHSATVRPSADTSSAGRPRPKTSDPRRVAPSPGLEPPRGAWASGTPSPLIRPLSAGPFHRPGTGASSAPTVDMDRILADGTLAASDPAVPLIAAIKTELEKCALPGSTTNLAGK